jgi:hypothetical protein
MNRWAKVSWLFSSHRNRTKGSALSVNLEGFSPDQHPLTCFAQHRSPSPNIPECLKALED